MCVCTCCFFALQCKCSSKAKYRKKCNIHFAWRGNQFANDIINCAPVVRSDVNSWQNNPEHRKLAWLQQVTLIEHVRLLRSSQATHFMTISGCWWFFSYDSSSLFDPFSWLNEWCICLSLWLHHNDFCCCHPSTSFNITQAHFNLMHWWWFVEVIQEKCKNALRTLASLMSLIFP